ncbi:hypothetical protein L6452_20861 [Arctium lappa]|uniref:Uncharacterized protein n=1 Tax=Arctium lappa TaxID=4217 RepID=A0ACB9BDC5_ARCLA|nr:hypothetical protein L6452_20861 [Arctium lappa]
MFMAPDKRSKRECEDQYYLQKIQELVDQKIAWFSRQDQSSSDDDQEFKVVAKKTKRRSPITDEDEYKMKKQKKKIQNKVYVGCSATNNEKIERLKEFVTEEMKGSDLMLVIQKILYATDLAKNQNRLSMPINQLETLEFLTADEKRLLDTKDGEIDVPLLGPTLRMHANPMKLKMWQLKTTCNYVLRTGWNQFVESNSEDLKEHRKVQVWSFRRDQQLCFALVCLENDAA